MEQDAKRRFPKAHPHLTDKVRDGGVWADQGVIAGCAGGLFDNITEAADILRGKYYRQRRIHLRRVPDLRARVASS